jgi:hypothetical protein
VNRPTTARARSSRFARSRPRASSASVVGSVSPAMRASRMARAEPPHAAPLQPPLPPRHRGAADAHPPRDLCLRQPARPRSRAAARRRSSSCAGVHRVGCHSMPRSGQDVGHYRVTHSC